jgi:peptidoglycan/LPS O-acetylase OafA/YrhL
MLVLVIPMIETEDCREAGIRAAIRLSSSLDEERSRVLAEVAHRRVKVFASLQAARALAVILALLCHCGVILNNPKYWNVSWQHYVYAGHSGVEIFFVLSGIVILYAHLGDIGNPAQVGSYLWKRFRRIYPVYWVALALTAPVFVLVPSFGRGFERQPMVILQSILLVHLTSTDRVLAVSWTLFHEIMFYAVFAMIILNRRAGTALLSVWVAASVYSLVFPLAHSVLAEYLSPLHLLFAFGICVTLLVRRYSIPGWPLAMVGAAGFVACFVYENHTITETDRLNVLYGACAAVLLWGAMLMEEQGHLQIPAPLKLVGDASYSIYLVHFPALSAIAKILYPLWRRFPTPLIVPFLIMAFLGTALGLLAHLYVEKPLLRWMSGSKQSVVERARASV